MSLYKDASLVMLPSAVKDGKLYSIRPTDGSGDFTFSRGSNLAATRVDVNGLIEKGRENFALHSNNFSDSVWSHPSSNTTSGQSGYDGSNDAWKFSSVSTGTAQITQSHSTSGMIVQSIYAKAGSVNVLKIYVGLTAEFNLTNGATSYSQSKMTDVGNGWWRCEVYKPYGTFNPFFTATSAGDYIYIQDAQTEQGLVATDYIETGASTAQAGILEDLPRLDYSGGASCPSLLLEPLRTNTSPHSEYLASYAINRGSVSSNVTTSPEGVVNASELVPTTVNGDHTVDATNILSATTYTISCFAKNNGNDISLTLAYNSTNWTGCIFDLTTGEFKTPQKRGAQSVCTADIEPYGEGWYRCSITATLFSASSWFTFVSLVNDTDGSLGISWGRQSFAGVPSQTAYLYGLQVEAGSYPTSYIPTYGSAVTRSSDSTSHIDVSSLGVTTGYTLFYELGNYDLSVASSWLAQGGTNGRAYEVYGTTAIIKTTAGDVYPFNHGLTGTGIKVAVNYDGININVFTNGTKRGTWAANKTIWDAITNLDMTLNNLQMVNWKQLLVFATALTDSECIALTS